MAIKKKLFEILDDNLIQQHFGELDVEIDELKLDSRQVNQGDVYFAISGYAADGHDYIESAIEKGARVIICEKIDFTFHRRVTIVQVEDSRGVMATMAASFYDFPSEDVKLIGVTGTNGKTTIATLLFQLYSKIGYKTGLISTVEIKIADRVIPATHTTPDVINLNRLIRQMVDEDCTYIFMEVSSHAIDQRRIEGLTFNAGLFTNMSRDHLDYHKTFKEYIWAKKKFFDHLPSDAFTLVNMDDKRGEVMIQNTKASKKSYALKSHADYKAKIISNEINGLQMIVDDVEAHFQLVGEFNGYNLLLVYACAVELGEDKNNVLTLLSAIKGAEGRFEKISNEHLGIHGIVDYAHTPDALSNVLSTIDRVKAQNSRIITVVGCGGDRDRGKRSVMARIATEYSYLAIFTSDNPRSEDPEKILDDMDHGLGEDADLIRVRISDRRKAIAYAVDQAKKGDVILIAGKGHEKYQEINGKKFPFDDKKILREAMLEVL